MDRGSCGIIKVMLVIVAGTLTIAETGPRCVPENLFAKMVTVLFHAWRHFCLTEREVGNQRRRRKISIERRTMKIINHPNSL